MKVDLAGVPETALWTLYHRALEARRPDALLDDPMAIELVDRIDYPFGERFGAGFPARPSCSHCGFARSTSQSARFCGIVLKGRSSRSAKGWRRSSGGSTTAT